MTNSQQSGWGVWTVDLDRLPPLYYTADFKALGSLATAVHLNERCVHLARSRVILRSPVLPRNKGWHWCSQCGPVKSR